MAAMGEKDALLPSSVSVSSVHRRPKLWLRFSLVALSLLAFSLYRDGTIAPHRDHRVSSPKHEQCPQVKALRSARSTKELDDYEDYLQSSTFLNKSITRLQGAVQIPTQSFDDLGGIGVDPRWDIFYSFADYLSATFPLVHTTLQLERVNTHALLYTWRGTDPSMKATVLMAHQDVVPVPDSTVKQWTHPPFSGHYDGTYVWGRGASDCKNQLIGILEAVEALIEAGFSPRRTLILSFGFDEEVSGQQGAKELSAFLLKRHGRNGAAVIVDEGAGIVEAWGAKFSIPGVAEKGYIDVEVIVRLPGGHSSIPPAHNGIGIASQLITLIEDSPYEPYLDDENPFLSMLHCGAEHGQGFPSKLKHLLHKRAHKAHRSQKHPKDALALEAAKLGLATKYLFTTSAAVDLISGGAKINALPERTVFTVNHRINVGSTSAVVKSHISRLAAQITDKYNLTLHAFNGTETPSSITLVAGNTTLEPAPVTPTYDSAVFSVLSGTTRALYADEGLLIAPGLMTGNTDTRFYWDLSPNIFRYGPGWDKKTKGLGNIHTVDERVGVQGHVDVVRWMWAFVRNMDELED